MLKTDAGSDLISGLHGSVDGTSVPTADILSRSRQRDPRQAPAPNVSFALRAPVEGRATDHNASHLSMTPCSSAHIGYELTELFCKTMLLAAASHFTKSMATVDVARRNPDVEAQRHAKLDEFRQCTH
jgi:hypothetical protein